MANETVKDKAQVQGQGMDVESVQVAKIVATGKPDRGDRPSKWARKKEKMTCYSCSETGLFVCECKPELCEIFLKPKHGTGKCPLTVAHSDKLNI